MQTRLDDIVMDCANERELAKFYSKLLDKPIQNHFNHLAISIDGIRIMFNKIDNYQPPIQVHADTPQIKNGGQTRQFHFDFTVSDLEEAVKFAQSLGAKLTEYQPRPKQYLALIDSAGHMFHLCLSN